MKLYLQITAIALLLLSFSIGISIEITNTKLPKPFLVFMAFSYFLTAIWIFIKIKNKS